MLGWFIAALAAWKKNIKGQIHNLAAICPVPANFEVLALWWRLLSSQKAE